MGHVRRCAILAIFSFCFVLVSVTVVADGGSTSDQPAGAPNGRNATINGQAPSGAQGQPNIAPTGRKDPGPANTPEAPLAILLPLIGAIAAGGMLYVVSTRRSRLPVAE